MKIHACSCSCSLQGQNSVFGIQLPQGKMYEFLILKACVFGVSQSKGILMSRRHHFDAKMQVFWRSLKCRHFHVKLQVFQHRNKGIFMPSCKYFDTEIKAF
jgi:hypothetical protein